MHLSPGAHVRSFEVLGPLGAGGMGAVYRARDPRLGREVAIKFLVDDLAGNREYLHRFEREARAASALNHPNIITIYEIGEHDGAPFIAMELVDGVSLRESLKAGPLSVRKLLDIGAQVADGLAAAHERGIVHRDLKPENVMLSKDGRAKILDFGLARVNRPASMTDSTTEFSAVRTPEGRILGTAAYVSPEQASGGRNVDYRSDQFSFGALLYEVATGRRAFERKSAIETLAAIVRDEPEPVQRLNPRLPPQLVWIIERCLAKEPADRYTSTRDLARELRTLRDRLPETSPGRLRAPVRWPVWTRAAVIVIAVLGVSIALISSSRRLTARTGALTNEKKHLAVLPFDDLSGRKDGQLFSQGFADAVSARLSRYDGIEVIPSFSIATTVDKKNSYQRIAQESGATLLLKGSVERLGDNLRVNFTIIDPIRGTNLSGDSVAGDLDDIWTVQDRVADAVARDLAARERLPAPKRIGLTTTREREAYVRALGALDHPDNPESIETAIKLLTGLSQSAPDSAVVQAALARAYRAQYVRTSEKETSDNAIRAADRARSLDPDSPDVLMTLGELQNLRGDYDGAIGSFQRAISIQPESAEAMLGLAAALKGGHDLAAAEESFRRSIDLRPGWWMPHNELGLLYLQMRRFDDAAREFRTVIEMNPDNSYGYINLGALNLQRGQIKEAAGILEKAAALGAPAAYSNLGYCYYTLGDYDRAAVYDQKAIDADPSIALRWVNLADACSWSATCRDRAARAYNKGIELLRRDLVINRNNARTHALLAICLAKTHQASEAKKQIESALRIDPTNPTRMYQAARVANANGDVQQARAWLDRAVAAGYSKSEVQDDPEFANLRSIPSISPTGTVAERSVR